VTAEPSERQLNPEPVLMPSKHTSLEVDRHRADNNRRRSPPTLGVHDGMNAKSSRYCANMDSLKGRSQSEDREGTEQGGDQRTRFHGSTPRVSCLAMRHLGWIVSTSG